MAKIYLAYDAFKALETCPQRYYLIKVKKAVEYQFLRNFLVGSVLHTLVEKWILTGYKKGFMTSYAPVYFDAEARNVSDWRGPDDRNTLRQRTVEYAKITEDVLRAFDIPGRRTLPEFWFRAILPKYPHVEIGGKIDLWIPSEPSLWDLKFTEDKRYFDADQTLFYSLVASLQVGKAVRSTGIIAPLLESPILKYEWEQQHRKDMYERIIRCVQIVESGEFPAIGDESRDCARCSVKQACERFHVEVDVREVDGRKRVSF